MIRSIHSCLSVMLWFKACVLVFVMAFFWALCVFTAHASPGASRGEALTTAQISAAVPVASLKDDRASSTGAAREVVLKGRIDKVCQAKGCWFTIRDAAKGGTGAHTPTVRVTSRGYLFFVPKDLSGRTAYVRGVLKRKRLSAAEVQHFAEDEARTAGAASTSGTGALAPQSPKGEKPEGAKAEIGAETFEWQLEAVGVAWEG